MYTIVNFSGYFYVNCKKTGKLLIEKSFRYYDDAKREAENLNKK